LFGFRALTWVNLDSQEVVSGLRILLSVIRAVSSVPVGKTAGQLGVWLRQELTRRGYDLAKGGQSRFAREADIHPSMVNRILTEDRGAELDVLRKMGKALGFTLGEMLIHAGQATREDLTVHSAEQLEAVSSSPYADPHERYVWAMVDLPESVRRYVVASLRTAIAMESEEDPRQNAEVHELRRRRS
jgi:transcriptional regulator with XRE-family HTH domain